MIARSTLSDSGAGRVAQVHDEAVSACIFNWIHAGTAMVAVAALTGCSAVGGTNDVCAAAGRVLTPDEMVRAAAPAAHLQPDPAFAGRVGVADIERIDANFHRDLDRILTVPATRRCCGFSTTSPRSDTADGKPADADRRGSYGIRGFVTFRHRARAPVDGRNAMVDFSSHFAVNACGTTAGVSG